MLQKLIAAAMLASIVGCANMGTGGEDRLSRNYIEQHLTVNKSTKENVRALYGEPSYKSESSNREDYWSYDENQINSDYVSQVLRFLPGLGAVGDAAVASQGPKTSRSLSFVFNSSGVLRSFNVSGNTGAGK